MCSAGMLRSVYHICPCTFNSLYEKANDFLAKQGKPRPKAGSFFTRNHQVWVNWGLNAGGNYDILKVEGGPCCAKPDTTTTPNGRTASRRRRRLARKRDRLPHPLPYELPPVSRAGGNQSARLFNRCGPKSPRRRGGCFRTRDCRKDRFQGREMLGACKVA